MVRLFAACGGLTVLAAFHTALAFAVGAATGRYGLAVAIAATVAVAGYLLAGLLATSAELRWLRVISPWEWLLARNVLVQGTPVLPLLIEIMIGAALVAAGAQRFTRRVSSLDHLVGQPNRPVGRLRRVCPSRAA